jgi:tetratricopeptide (TPR) repeat protein
MNAQRIGRRMPRPRSHSVLFTLCLALTALPSPVAGHGDLHERIAAVTRRIEQEPRNPELYLKRGELHRFHRDWDAALADYERVTQLDPRNSAADLARGLVFLEAGWPRSARIALDRFLVSQPDRAEAHAARARALVQLGERRAAADSFGRAIALRPQPDPEDYLERAQALAGAGEAYLDEALRGLDEGMQKLGPLVALQLYAIDLERQRKKYDAALARLDHLAAPPAPEAGQERHASAAAPANRSPGWLERRGEILEEAGRPAEARAAYEAALAAIASLPSHRRGVKATVELEARLRAAIARLGKGEQASVVGR